MTKSRFIEICDFHGHMVHIDAARVVSIRAADPARYNDHGSVTLDTGETISFRSDSGPLLLLQRLEALHAEPEDPTVPS